MPIKSKWKKSPKNTVPKRKMADIFSNADQKPRLKNDNPLDVDAEKANEPTPQIQLSAIKPLRQCKRK